jgi:hypothetical protein
VPSSEKLTRPLSRIAAIKEILDRGYGKATLIEEEQPKPSETAQRMNIEPFQKPDGNEQPRGPITLGDLRRSS